MEVEFFVENTTHSAIRQCKGGCMLAGRTLRRLQDRSSDTVNVFWSSDSSPSPNSLFHYTTTCTEVFHPQQNGFAVRNRVARGNPITSSQRTLHCNNRLILRKIRLDSKSALLIRPSHVYN
ncbi:hypothetical protein J6590_108244 [Homalodisca vitripennis]|nr:hypothetical protein J6590_108289 [Homalodisca vitripennis]KAG8250083.1 hypothetical protein J6590_108367 [Homalodisca vitripennis]KAG8291174.1 hypothetical protein J6590_108189 [Homalodisca vitripennis]KAG8315389.1 hypothetical protein J6590_108244 [Homalodisca vitripennis]